ncbi:hypothetical protein QKW35_14585 [Pontibacterium granulatum]|uniref:hypothetical protein n=1 Tax=Pontibacterium granulatum TaxID=2036029 RepID=UPI00249C2C4C|nr:hypothetical protein [Pontibacterium granulatum]MDI3325602.1 hypothetical protein [Pontibacterium granulatum]
MTPADISNWGQQPPQWIEQLARAVGETSRAAVAKRLKISRTSVSLLLANKYPSPSTQKMQAKVEATFGGVSCPVLGEISNAQCQTERKKGFIGSNPTRVRLCRTCPGCPNNPHRETHND